MCVWAGKPGNWGGGVWASKPAHPSHKCHTPRDMQEYFIVSLKVEPPLQLFCPSMSSRARASEKEGMPKRSVEGLLVKAMGSCYWGLGEIGCGSRVQIFLAPHTRVLAPRRALVTRGAFVFISETAMQTVSETTLTSSVFTG